MAAPDLEWEGPPAFIFLKGVQLSCPRCTETQLNFKKEVGTNRHYCETCDTLYETAEQVIAETQEKEVPSG